MSHITIKPTFLLKGIDAFALSNEYPKKNLASLEIKKKKVSSVNLTSNRGKTFRDPIFTFKGKGLPQTLATTNVKSFVFEDKKGLHTCEVCRREFDHKPMGIPVSIKEEDGVFIIFTLYTTCDFRCTLTLIRRLGHHVNFEHSEEFLKLVFRKLYPDKILTPAPDPMLHVLNGGSLSQEEYTDERYTYYHLPNLILYPAKEQYTRNP